MVLMACASPPPPTPPPPTATAASLSESETSNNGADGLRTFVVDPSNSQVSYIVDEEFLAGALSKLGIEAGLVDVIGSTQAIEGQLELNPDDLSVPLGDSYFTVDTTTLKTDQDRRDNWIRSNGPDFNAYPTASFTAISVAGMPESYTPGETIDFQLSGDLTIREVTQPVTFDVSAALDGDTLNGVATVRLLMSDFGIDPPNFANTLTVEDEFGLEITLTAREQ
jgi:polyisoprenoid-binding protein YceI